MQRVTFESSQRSIEVLGAKVHYHEAGEGPALLGFHGGGPGANGWDNTKWNIDELSQRFRVVLVDLPGYGRSEWSEVREGETNDQYYARFIVALLDALGLERAHLFGTSMSGAPVIRVGADHPERVDRMVLKSPGGMGRELLTPTPLDGIVALNEFRADPTPENMARMMRLFVPDPTKLTQEMVDARFESAQLAMAHPRPARQPVPYTDVRSLLPRLSMPVLVLWGRNDHMVALEGHLSALALIPQVQVHLWGGGTGHFVEFEHTADFNRLVGDFLAG